MFFSQLNNPDMRVMILRDYAKEHFPSTPILDYAYEVEKITTSKVCIIVFFQKKVRAILESELQTFPVL